MIAAGQRGNFAFSITHSNCEVILAVVPTKLEPAIEKPEARVTNDPLPIAMAADSGASRRKTGGSRFDFTLLLPVS